MNSLRELRKADAQQAGGTKLRTHLGDTDVEADFWTGSKATKPRGQDRHSRCMQVAGMMRQRV